MSYAYVLLDSEHPLYVGKGSGERVFSSASRREKERSAWRAREGNRAPPYLLEPVSMIVADVDDDQTAFEVEARVVVMLEKKGWQPENYHRALRRVHLADGRGRDVAEQIVRAVPVMMCVNATLRWSDELAANDGGRWWIGHHGPFPQGFVFDMVAGKFDPGRIAEYRRDARGRKADARLA